MRATDRERGWFSSSCGYSRRHRSRSRVPQIGFGAAMKWCSTPNLSAEQLAEPPHPERLGGVVARRDEVRSALERVRHHVLGGLSGEERVQTDALSPRRSSMPPPPTRFRRCAPGRARCPRRTAPGRRPRRSGASARRTEFPQPSVRRSRRCARGAARTALLAPARARRRSGRCCRPRGGRPAAGDTPARPMSLSKRTRRRSFMVGDSERGWKSQNSPWWAITSWAPASAAWLNKSRWADTPVATTVTSFAPGTWRPFGP